MGERLRDAVSPYLRSHAGNPVDWFPWGTEAFDVARERDVPLLVSIGYATCHWCHVMARETFSDPDLAARLNRGFVAIKVDREEHPEVDAACLAAAGAFTPDLGWPLNVFMTPEGRVFHAGTYSPPRPAAGRPSFRQVLDAVEEAWVDRRDDVEASAAGLAAALREATAGEPPASPVGSEALVRVVDELAGYEDRQHGGFGGAPKFPVAPLLLTLLALGQSPLLDADRRAAAHGIAERALTAMRDGGLRDPVGGGFFRYAVRRDWTEPHYERMLTDNALLLRAYAELGDRGTAAGIVSFLRGVLRRPGGAFGSAQDSESLVDGVGSEGGYYALDVESRAGQPAPAVDAKVITGWNGLAIGALAAAGARLGEPDWIVLAVEAAEAVLATQLRDDVLLRVSLDGRASGAVATLEDHGGLADGLLEVALAAGRPDLAVIARGLVDGCLRDGRLVAPATDAVLAALGVPGGSDASEGASPSGPTLIASAAWKLHLLTADPAYLGAAAATIGPLAAAALDRPIGSGGALGLGLAMAEPIRQVVVVVGEGVGDALATAARRLPSSITAVLDVTATEAFAAAGFELFASRATIDGRSAAYVCTDFVCRLPVTEAAALV